MKILRIIFVVLFVLATGRVSPQAQTHTDKKIKVLILTGGHGFKAEPFFKMFAYNPEITFTNAAQGKAAEAYERDDLYTYDVVVLYDSPSNITDAQKARFLGL